MLEAKLLECASSYCLKVLVVNFLRSASVELTWQCWRQRYSNLSVLNFILKFINITSKEVITILNVVVHVTCKSSLSYFQHCSTYTALFVSFIHVFSAFYLKFTALFLIYAFPLVLCSFFSYIHCTVFDPFTVLYTRSVITFPPPLNFISKYSSNTNTIKTEIIHQMHKRFKMTQITCVPITFQEHIGKGNNQSMDNQIHTNIYDCT